MRARDIKTKRPWRRIKPDGYMRSGWFMEGNEPSGDNAPNLYSIITQSDFLKEYYPSGHAINDPMVYPDIYRMEEEPLYDQNGDPIITNGSSYVREYHPVTAEEIRKVIAN